MSDRPKCLQPIDGSCVWVPSIVACIARFLPANEIACKLRFVAKETSQQYANCKTVRLSHPSPTHIFEECWGRPESFRAYTRKQRLKLLCLTATSGSIANLKIALENAGLCVQGLKGSELLKAAAEAGHLDVCKMLRERGCSWGSSLAAAARGGHRHVCEWMLTSGCPLTLDAVMAAARGGHEGLMYWLMITQQIVHPIYVLSLLCAAAVGLSLAAFQRLHQQLLTGQRQDGEAQQQQQPAVGLHRYQQVRILAAAVASSTPDWQAKVEWLEGQDYPQTYGACESAAACSPDEEAVRRLQWLCSRGYPPDGGTVEVAASRGNLAALCWLVEQAGVRPCQGASIYAAINGRLAVLQYLHTTGHLHLEPQNALLQMAAEEGRLPVVAWAVEALGVTPDHTSRLFNCAADNGSVELMTWLRERGWTWGLDTMYIAVRSGCEEAVEWLVEQGCPWPPGSFIVFDPIGAGDLAMIRCLHRCGCPWSPNELEKCVNTADLALVVPTLRCLVELGCPVDWDVAVREAEERPPGEDRTALLTWLAEERQRRSLGAQMQQQQQ